MRAALGRWLLGGVFVAAGLAHLVAPQVYLTAMPGWLPAPYALVVLSGVAELAGGLGVLLPNRRLRHLSGWGLALLLAAVFPANLHMALAAPGLWWLWARLPLQGALIAWALRSSGAVNVYEAPPGSSGASASA